MTAVDTPVLESAFGLENQWLLWSRLRLYPDRLMLCYWKGLSLRRQCVRLTRVDRVEQPTADRLRLRLDDDQTLRLHVDSAGEWREMIVAYRDV